MSESFHVYALCGMEECGFVKYKERVIVCVKDI